MSVHFLLVVQQTVGCARDGNGGVQAQRLSCGQNQLTLQLQLVILKQTRQQGKAVTGVGAKALQANLRWFDTRRGAVALIPLHRKRS